ncbi:MAG TPA: hypothetical protein VMU41_00115 [Candidatus Binataceae bacterium]|nr:hypothetical protein [Candidatus Binataceae bacterium]
MALLDFIKNRQTQQQSSAPEAKPETAKEMYARESVQQKSSEKSPASLSPDQQARVREVQATMQQAAHSPDQTSSPASPSEGATNPQPMAQMTMNQDKAAPALSPTTAQTGTRSHEHENASPSPAQTPARTMPRPQPSWER